MINNKDNKNDTNSFMKKSPPQIERAKNSTILLMGSTKYFHRTNKTSSPITNFLQG